MKVSLKVNVFDNVTIVDKLSTWKKWFNGSKFFHTVKVLPKKK